jgi:hypothetical protein
MAGRFPSGREFNVFRDIPSSQYVFANWPSRVWFSGFEIGMKIKCGLPLVGNEGIQNSPVKDVFRISLPQAEEDRMGRKSWDETAVLVALNGYERFYKVEEGRIQIADDGSNTWDGNGKGQFHLVEDKPVADIQALIDTLIMHPPSRK